MCYICSTNAGNNILRAHFGFLAYRNGVPLSRLINIAKKEVDRDVAADAAVGAKEVTAMALAEAASGTPSTMSPSLVGLVSRQFSPAGVIELITTVSVAFMFHRWTSVYVPKRCVWYHVLCYDTCYNRLVWCIIVSVDCASVYLVKDAVFLYMDSVLSGGKELLGCRSTVR